MADLFEAKPGSYWVCFDTDETQIKNIHSRILAAKFIKSWWNQIPRLYILQSDLDRADFYHEMNNLLPIGNYLIGAFEGGFGGRLSFEQWKNLLNTTPEKLRTLEIAAEQEVKRREAEQR